MSSPSSSEKCSGGDDSPQDSDCSNTTDPNTTSPKNKSARSITSFFKRRGRSLIGKNGKNNTTSSSSSQICDGTTCCGLTSSSVGHESERRSQKWLPGRIRKTKPTQIGCCSCSCYRRNEENNAALGGEQEIRRLSIEAEVVQETAKNGETVAVAEVEVVADEAANVIIENVAAGDPRRGDFLFRRVAPFTDVFFSPQSLEDVEEEARIERAREIERGVDPPPSFRPPKRLQVLCNDAADQEPQRFQLICPADVTIESLRVLFQSVHIRAAPLDNAGCHTQIDFIHCLVPDLLAITNCSFYWGKMDRYEAERLLDGKREGTFLLRDSAQEEFLFSVSFRKYGRSLHARIEQWNHRFSFDSHDPGVYTSDTVCGLIEHYKDPSSCMFFEPMLTWPLHRTTVFSLQHLCRATIASRLSYDDIRHLQLPKSLKLYLKEYHYRQKVRVARFDEDLPWIDIRNNSNLPFNQK